MSTATPIIQNQVQYLEPARVRESPLNPRKTFNEKALEDLAADVAVHGVMQPILVRQISPSGQVLFEVIFGARRLRAAKMAKLESIRAFVEEMSDAEALERMMSENVQRADFDAFEEADGYRRLHKEYGLTADAIAEKVGKSRAHVYGRMKLTELSPAARKVVQDRGLGPERALMIARIPGPDRQLEAAKNVAGTQYYAGEDAVPMSVRHASTWIRDHFMLKLAGAPFDTKDAELVKKAGPCTTCPFRTTNTPDLFGDIGKADLCTKPECFNEKKAASWAAERKEAKDSGLKVLTEAEAKDVFRGYGDGEVAADAAYVSRRDTCFLDPKRRTWGQLMGKEAPKPSVVGRNTDGKVVELIPKADVLQLLEDRGHKFVKEAKKHDAGAGARRDDWDRRQEAERRRREEERKVAHRAVAKLVEKVEAKQPDKAFWRLLIDSIESDYGIDEGVVERRGWDDEEYQKQGIGKRLDRMSEGQLRGFFFELEVARDLRLGHALKKLCDFFDVKLDKVKAELKAEKQAAQEEARQKDKERKAEERKSGAKKAKKAESGRTAELVAGVCVGCGCTDDKACGEPPNTCAWLNMDRTHCSACFELDAGDELVPKGSSPAAAEVKPTSCQVAGCKRPLKARGLCGAHYSVARRKKLAKA